MNAEITDESVNNPTGWVFFDAECQFCIAHRHCWGRIFERRGFVWLPLQHLGAAERLGITELQLHEEMWLQLADGRKFRGANAWSRLMRHVWWLWLPGVILTLPGFRVAARRLYRWFAKNRHCFVGGGAISPRQSRKSHRHATFLEFP